MIGRRRELAYLHAFLDAAAGRPMALTLLGEPGVGRTTLLGALARQARERGFRVVRLATGAALLRRLSASTSLPGDPDALLTRLLPAVDRLCAAAPVLVLVDRADRADAWAGRLITLLLRHLSAERFSVVLAVRGHEPPCGLGPEIPRRHVEPLPDEDAARLLPELAGRSRQERLRQAAGNPSALLGARLPDEYGDLVEALPAVTRRLLLHAALADESEPVAAVSRAAGGELRDWEPAERAGLVTVFGRVRFAHPLLRQSLAGSAWPDEIRRAHAALAVCAGSEYRRAMHHAAAAERPDEPVAAALERAATRAAPLDAARALQLAAEHSPRAGTAVRRYGEAVLAACYAGEPAWAIELHRRAAELTTDAVRLAPAAAGAGLALIQTGRPGPAFELLDRIAAGGPLGGQVGPVVVSMAATAVLLTGDAGHRRRLPALLDRADVSPAVRAFVRAVADPDESAGADPDEPAGPAPSEAGAAQQLFVGAVAWLRDDTAAATKALSAGWRALDGAGVPGAVIAQLPQLILSLMDMGRWPEATDLLDRTERLAAVCGATLLDTVLPALRATLRAWQGCGPSPAPPGPAAGGAFAAGLHRRAAGLCALAAADHETAYEQFRALFDDAGVPRHFVLGPLVLPQLALTAVRTGRAEAARAVVEGVRGRAIGGLSCRRAMLADHATALLDDSEPAYRRALADRDRALVWPLEYAEAQLNYGIWLRRQRRTREARPHLTAALDTFLRLGARAHADQARRYVPGREEPDAGPAFAALTAQKQRIARMAAEGLRNEEIARQLHVSPRTVASHLYTIFPQLGVTSRHQLRDLLTATGRSS
ncbi:LuxR C-terminal-related transcriptional regulator [Actinoplanes sp. Pm04-4]|uniref:LuxR C-terminal-related transcriptional regulator n=1 Tax=Paractinoplanes pyxinae TaxID=2997416 RepID=A0ABT4AR80_9ACTN|nr:LuxR family transcriptional regulator [Actinoplanes pyxinae]MCY1136754.1 LuxR C-terminal-related transcriptional regulator [Actinoplanes pyxinae]